MKNGEFRAALRENKGGVRKRYYFGEPAPNYPQIFHWDYNIPGKITFEGSTLVFIAENFSPKQPRKNILLNPYFNNEEAVGTLILKLDLKKARSIKQYPNRNRNYNYIWLRFYVHGGLLKDKIRDLNFSIRAETKDQIIDLYRRILKARVSGESDSEIGSLKFIDNKDLGF